MKIDTGNNLLDEVLRHFRERVNRWGTGVDVEKMLDSSRRETVSDHWGGSVHLPDLEQLCSENAELVSRTCREIMFNVEKRKTVAAIRARNADVVIADALAPTGVQYSISRSGDYGCFLTFSVPNGQQARIRLSYTKLETPGNAELLTDTVRSLIALTSSGLGRISLKG